MKTKMNIKMKMKLKTRMMRKNIERKTSCMHHS